MAMHNSNGPIEVVSITNNIYTIVFWFIANNSIDSKIKCGILEVSFLINGSFDREPC
jgi:hypothetical protein